MIKTKIFIVGKILVFLLVLSSDLWSGSNKKNTENQTHQSPTAQRIRASLLNINNISMWASDDGLLERKPPDMVAGVTFPKGTAQIVNAGGLVWGGLVSDGRWPLLRVGGQTVSSGTVPGRIISPGISENPQIADVRVYRIRRDWATADLANDASEYFSIPLIDITQHEIEALRTLYKKDWMEWPWQKGAPYYERNGIPGYQPDTSGIIDSTKDEPGLGNADQVIWFVANDLDPNATGLLYGSPPIGLELQVTCWAYNHFSELNNVIFQRFRLIYKGTSTTPPSAKIDSMYIAKWVDPDIGDYGDDLVGCVVDRNLGYAYNANPTDYEFTKFKLTPAVVGYDLLQGPRIPKAGSSARWDIKTISGYANLPMTSFTYFTSSSNRNADFDLNASIGSYEWWNILRGYKPRPASSQLCMIDPVTNGCTSFELTGDPQLYHGWIDGTQDPAGDRRFAIASGPFAMSFGDTQEVVLGLVAGIGQDNRDGIGVVKITDDKVQDAYNLNFEFPKPVPPPKVRIVELENKIILDWESDTAYAREVEAYNSKGYKFETYTVYQFPFKTSLKEEAIKYQTLDPAQFRYVYITTDKLRKISLINGQKYYFAVVTTAYNPDPSFAQQRLESEYVIREIVPHSPNPGTIYPYEIGDVLSNAQNVVGNNDASVRTTIYDPARSDGHSYKILFNRNKDPMKDLNEKAKWSLIDYTLNDTLLKMLPSDGPSQRVVSRGFSVQVMLAPHGYKGVFQSQYNYKITHDNVFNYPNPQSNYIIVGAGTSQLDTITGQSHRDSDVELRFTGDSSWALFRGGYDEPNPRWVRVPYTAWEVGLLGRDSVKRQLYTAITAPPDDNIWHPDDILHLIYNGKSVKTFYPITIVIEPTRVDNTLICDVYYDDAPTRPDEIDIRGALLVSSFNGDRRTAVQEVYIADIDNDSIAVPKGTIIRFEKYKEVRNGDEKMFIPAPVIANNIDEARRAMDLINVFPNPYYGMNSFEINRFQRFVTFSHLPYSAMIRIFNLAGILVKTIRKDDATQFATWDLNNENGLQAAGGLYLAHIELKDIFGRDLGEKILKLMIVPEDQSPENH